MEAMTSLKFVFHLALHQDLLENLADWGRLDCQRRLNAPVLCEDVGHGNPGSKQKNRPYLYPLLTGFNSNRGVQIRNSKVSVEAFERERGDIVDAITICIAQRLYTFLADPVLHAA